jgi:hypothetical protein
MPKLCRMRDSVSEPFSCPIMQIGWPLKAAKAADDGLILAEVAVPGERGKIGDQFADVIEAVRALGWRATCVFCHGVSAA